MGYSADNYREQLKALLPPGQAFPRERGTTLDALLAGMAIELARVDARADALAAEANPATTTELLADWERVAGLPDPCVAGQAQSLQVRRSALVSKLSGTGGQSPAYFIAVALALGYVVTIDEFRPFRAGSFAGDEIAGGDWVFTWRINAPSVSVVPFRVESSTVGEPLRAWGNELLECRLSHLKPAHTILLFAYAAEDGGEEEAPTAPAVFFAAGAADNRSSLPASPAWPAGHQAGDDAFALVETSGAASITLQTANGFSLVAEAADASNNTRLSVWHCRATSGAMAAPVFNPAPGNHQSTRIYVWRGCQDAAPIAGFTTSSSNVPSTSVSAPGITTDAANTVVVSFIARDTDSSTAAFSAWANADLTGVVGIGDDGSLVGDGGGIGTASGLRAAAGVVGPTTATLSAPASVAAITIALRPAPIP